MFKGLGRKDSFICESMFLVGDGMGDMEWAGEWAGEGEGDLEGVLERG